jgi:hypothetical protein
MISVTLTYLLTVKVLCVNFTILTQVLDLDETLVHYFELDGQGYYDMRPGCIEFLQKMNALGMEVVVRKKIWGRIRSMQDECHLIKSNDDLHCANPRAWGSHYGACLTMRLARDGVGTKEANGSYACTRHCGRRRPGYHIRRHVTRVVRLSLNQSGEQSASSSAHLGLRRRAARPGGPNSPITSQSRGAPQDLGVWSDCARPDSQCSAACAHGSRQALSPVILSRLPI